jgi:hypothetical protein
MAGVRVYHQKHQSREIRQMPEKSKQFFYLTLILGSILFAAQMHCCVDVNSRSPDSHVCPICSATGTAITTPSPMAEMIPSSNHFEISGVVVSVPLVAPRNIAPRAPPAA